MSTTNMTAFESVREALRDHGSKFSKDTPTEIVAQCPAHDDNNPSLSVSAGAGCALIYCFAGCRNADIMRALGMRLSDLYDDRKNKQTYDYVDLAGKLNRTVTRTVNSKKFSQSVTQKNTVILFNLPDVVKAVQAGHPIYFVEGEKDALNGHARTGETFTSAPQGASNVGKVDASPLAGAHVIAVVDKDRPGQDWKKRLGHLLDGVARKVEWKQALHGKDLSDHLAAGGTLDDLDPVNPPERSQDENTAGPDSGMGYTLTPLSEVRPVRARFLWDGILPLNRAGLLGGNGGCGKSTFSLWLAAQVSRGLLSGELKGRPRNIIIVANEDGSSAEWSPRYLVNDGDAGRAFAGQITNTGEDGTTYSLPMSLPRDMGLLEGMMDDCDPALIIIDPISSALEGKNDDSQDVQKFMHRLNALAADRACTILGILHTNKGGGKANAKLNGSGQWWNASRYVLQMERDQEQGDTVMSVGKLNMGSPSHSNYSFRVVDSPVIGQDGQPVLDDGGIITAGKVVDFAPTGRTYEQLINRAPDTEEVAEDRSNANEWVRDYFDRYSSGVHADVLKLFKNETGMSAKTFQRALSKNGINRTKVAEFQGRTILHTGESPYVDADTPHAQTSVRIGERKESFRLDSNDSPKRTQTGQDTSNVQIVSTLEEPSNSNEKSLSDSQSGHVTTSTPGLWDNCPVHGELLDSDGRCAACLKANRTRLG